MEYENRAESPTNQLDGTETGGSDDILLPSGIDLKKSYLTPGYPVGNVVHEKIFPQYNTNHNLDILDKNTRKRAHQLTGQMLKAVGADRNFDIKLVKSCVKSIINNVERRREGKRPFPLVMLTDDDIRTHAINVCTISVICGMILGLGMAELERLGLAALLHDVGKAFIPEHILKKQGKLSKTEFNVIKAHTSSGFAYLQKHPGVDAGVARTALLHHERADGSGYPVGLKLDSLDKFSRIVAVADIYDAITSERAYRPGIGTGHAIEYLVSYGFHFLDYEIVRAFVDNISIYPDGTKVVLLTGEFAQVIAQNPGMPTRPIIRMLADSSGIELQGQELVDLTENTRLIIKSILG